MIRALFFLVLSLLIPTATQASIASVMTELKNRTLESGSDVVIVTRDGKIIFQYLACEHLEALDSQEMAKALLGLAYGFLIQDGKIPSLDVAVRKFYSGDEELPAEYRSDITLGDLFGQVSGLTDEACFSSNWEESPIEAILPPKVRYRDNNNNWRLLHRLVKEIAGLPFEDYILKKLFIPLDIQNVSWNFNSFDTPLRVYLLPQDWIKIGYFLLNKGCLAENKLLSDGNWHRILSASQRCNPFEGLGWTLSYYNLVGWWDSLLLENYRKAGMKASCVSALESLQGRELHFTGQLCSSGPLKFQPSTYEPMFTSEGFTEWLVDIVKHAGLPLCNFRVGKLKAYSAQGKGGQQLYIYPQGKIVALRQKKISRLSDGFEDAFEDFPCLIERLSAEYEGWVD